MKILAITQARVGSTRLPGKILKTIQGASLLEIHLRRILKSTRITKLKVATTNEPEAEKIVRIASLLGVAVYKGSLDNVLERFYFAAKDENPDWIVRLTSDCPLIDPVEIDRVIEHAVTTNSDYVSNTLTPTFPDGIDVEVFKFAALTKAYNEAQLTSEKEHVTPYIWKNSTFKGGTLFTSANIMNEIDYSSVRLTVDTEEDFLVIENLINVLGVNSPWIDYVKTLENHPEIKKLNQQYTRNEGYAKSLENEKEKNNG